VSTVVNGVFLKEAKQLVEKERLLDPRVIARGGSMLIEFDVLQVQDGLRASSKVMKNVTLLTCRTPKTREFKSWLAVHKTLKKIGIENFGVAPSDE